MGRGLWGCVALLSACATTTEFRELDLKVAPADTTRDETLVLVVEPGDVPEPLDVEVEHGGMRHQVEGGEAFITRDIKAFFAQRYRTVRVVEGELTDSEEPCVIARVQVRSLALTSEPPLSAEEANTMRDRMTSGPGGNSPRDTAPEQLGFRGAMSWVVTLRQSDAAEPFFELDETCESAEVGTTPLDIEAVLRSTFNRGLERLATRFDAQPSTAAAEQAPL